MTCIQTKNATLTVDSFLKAGLYTKYFCDNYWNDTLLTYWYMVWLQPILLVETNCKTGVYTRLLKKN